MEDNFRVGEWLVQPTLGSIRKGDKSIHLEPKVMDVLVYLAKHSDEVLTKQCLISAVWPDTFVQEDVLIHAISELRKAFEDDVKNPKVIQTIPKRGYQFIAPVEVPKDGSSWTRVGLAVLAVVLIFACGLFWLWHSPVPLGEPIDSIAILPLENLYDLAIQQAEKLLETDPNYQESYVLLAMSYRQKGMEEEFLEAELKLAKMANISEDRIAKAREDFRESGLESFGPTLTEPGEGKPIGKALHLLWLGNKDEAFDWLAKSWDLPLWGYENAPSNRFLDPLRNDPRFAELLRKQQLPDEAIQRHLSLGR